MFISMDKIFSIVRKLHLYASFVIASFLLMYFLTGAVIIMNKVFPRKNTTLSENVALKTGQAPEDAIKEIISRYNIHGNETRTTGPNGFTYTFIRPAYRSDITFVDKEGNFRVNIRKGTFWAAMNDFHRLRGYSGWAHKIWAVLYDLSCIALIVFALSGIYLWWKLERKKIPGAIFLLISSGITVFTIWYLIAVG